MEQASNIPDGTANRGGFTPILKLIGRLTMVTKTEQKQTGRECLCGCGETPKGPNSRYLPGHDLRDFMKRQKEAGL